MEAPHPSIHVVRPSGRQYEPDPHAEGSEIHRLHADAPYAHLLRLSPGTTVDLHSHTANELMAVLEGTVTVGGVSCESGSVVTIPAGARYDLVVGDERTVVLVVRPHHGAAADPPAASGQKGATS